MGEGFTVWFTGLPGAGKSTLAEQLASALRSRGFKTEVLDGDVVRTNLSRGLGYSRADRDTNVRRIGFVCKLLGRNGVVAIAALISPYREARDELRASMDNFVEVFVKCPVDVLVKRDVKGMYCKALKGEIHGFTGISDPYEEPLSPEITVETDRERAEESLERILVQLERLGYLPESPLPMVPDTDGTQSSSFTGSSLS